MLLNNFDPAVNRIDNIILGSFNEELNEKEIISKNLPFLDIISPIERISVSPVYSLDGENWFSEFPFKEAFEEWKNGSHDVVQGIIRFKIEVIPYKTMSICEIGFFEKQTLFMYRKIKEFIVGKMEDSSKYVFNYNLKCDFVSSRNINYICKVCV